MCIPETKFAGHVSVKHRICMAGSVFSCIAEDFEDVTNDDKAGITIISMQ